MNPNMFMIRPFHLVETGYSIFVILISLVIYFRTRHMYKLTEHKGIKYFSYTFLFFAIAYLFRFVSRILFRLIFDPTTIRSFPREYLRFGDLIFIYASVMSGLFLLYSVIWKKIKLKEKTVILFFNIFAIIAMLFDFFLRNPFIHISMITILFFATVIISFNKSKKSKKKHPFYVAYVLIFLIWILNLISIEISKFLHELRFGIYVVSCVIYILILLRVLKINKKKK
ncbi:hypothetical protein HOD20_02735 [archaeon]|jgi:hypothetical protein|nr:hypothetical protein [archaeon]MBT4351422.1 hypothetical protein [archaeon]MBT4647287.1 hypothetical protein [archaeon]MBT6821150.1 hypothetical protein [archaeon]MBT7391682.1 hypothetical protein [archaeon]